MRSTITASLAFLACAHAAADVTLPAAFTDHMVLQRDTPMRVFGSAPPNEQVEVELRDSKGAVLRSGKAVAGQGGRFSVELEPMKGSADPMTLEVRGANSVIVNDVVIGDVWVAGGQSNMEWNVADTGSQATDAAAAANDPQVRYLRTPKVTSNRPEQTIAANWTVLSPVTAPSMGAVGFWFANALRKETGVPIGILEINWGGTRAEPWTDLSTLATDPLYTDDVAELKRKVDAWNSLPAPQRDRAFEDARRKFQSEGTAWWSSVNAGDPGARDKWFSKEDPADISEWGTVTLPAKWSLDPARKAWDGIEWYRRTVEIPAEWAGKECFIDLGSIDDADIVFLDGRPIANTIADWTTQRHYRVPASLVKAGSATIAIEVLDLQGEGGLVGTAEQMRMTCPEAGNASVPLAGEWRARRGREAKEIAPPPQRPRRDQAPGMGYGDPGAMFNAMIAPFAGLQVTGAIWYQGESNASNMRDAEAYRTLLPLTIRSWRAAFDQPDMPFGIVSLAAFHQFVPGAATSGIWPTLRDAQLGTERTSPNTGTIATIDVGDAADIHPRDKRTVGERLARWATATAYGKPDTAWRGPRTKSARRDGDGIFIDFDVERGRLATRDGKAPDGFAIAGADGVFVLAEAELRPPSGIRLRSDRVAMPTEVRYAWQDNPANANVIDELSKLPAHPFRIRVEADPIRGEVAPAPPAAPAAK